MGYIKRPSPVVSSRNKSKQALRANDTLMRVRRLIPKKTRRRVDSDPAFLARVLAPHFPQAGVVSNMGQGGLIETLSRLNNSRKHRYLGYALVMKAVGEGVLRPHGAPTHFSRNRWCLSRRYSLTHKGRRFIEKWSSG